MSRKAIFPLLAYFIFTTSSPSSPPLKKKLNLDALWLFGCLLVEPEFLRCSSMVFIEALNFRNDLKIFAGDGKGGGEGASHG